jgi:hypothetical protein
MGAEVFGELLERELKEVRVGRLAPGDHRLDVSDLVPLNSRSGEGVVGARREALLW